MSDGAPILIVDDDPKIRKTLSDILRVKGYDVLIADQGKIALEMVVERTPDVALIDLKLGDMSGMDLMEEIKARSPDTECIVITGHATTISAIQAANLGVYSYFQKPYDMEQLLLAIRRAIEKQESGDALQKRNEEIQLLYEASQQFSRSLDLAHIFDRLNDMVGSIMDRDALYVSSYDPESDLIRCIYAFQDGSRLDVSEFPLIPLEPEGQGTQSLVLRSGEPLRIPDFQAQVKTAQTNYAVDEGGNVLDPQEVPPEADVIRSALIVPLVLESEVVGAIQIFSYRLDAFSEDDLSILDTLASQVAVASNNAFLYQQAQNEIVERKLAEDALRREKDKAQNYLDLAGTILVALNGSGEVILLNQKGCDVLAYDEGELIGENWFEVALPDSVREEIFNVFQHLIDGASEPSEYYESLIVTKTGEERLIAWSNILLRNEEGNITGTLSSGTDITERVQREREMEAVVTVANAMRTASTQAEILPVILDQLVDLLNALGAAVVLTDPSSGEAVIQLARGMQSHATGVRMPPGEGVSGEVIATGETYTTQSILSDSQLFAPDLFEEDQAGACVPLIAQEQTTGALWVFRPAAFNEEEVRILEAIADMAANAIQRAALNEETQRRLQRLDALHTVDMAITGSLDLQFTLDILLSQVTGHLDVDAAAVLQLDPHLQMLEYAAGYGFRTDQIQKSQVRVGEKYAGLAVLERRFVSLNDKKENELPPDFSRLLSNEGFSAYLAVPLISKAEVKGVLEIFHRSPMDPDSEWMDFLETLAARAAVAMDNAELFDDLQRSNQELALAYDATLEGWVHALDLRDEETEGHTQRVTEMTLKLAQVMGIDGDPLLHIRRGALLHDIGKMGIPDRILLKPGPLTSTEMEIVKQHPVYAYELLAPIKYLAPALDIPYCHHERWDGSGYPRGLKGEQIPLAARIFAIVDVWDALRSDRPYRSALPEKEVLSTIDEQKASHFDPQVLEAFQALLKSIS